MLQFLIDLFWILVWCVLSLIDLVFAIFFPKGRVHKMTSEIYHKHVKDFLTGSKMSRTSYSFAHGFFVSLVFFLVLVVSCFLYKQYSSGVEEIANKFITIGISSSNGGRLQSLDLSFNPSWTSKDPNIEPEKRGFSMMFKVNESIKHATEYIVSARSNFNASFRTEAIEALSMKQESISPKEMTSIINFEYLPREQRDTLFYAFFIMSDAPILDDEENPSVNLYLSFDQSIIELLSDSTGNIRCNDTKLNIWLNSQRYDTLQTNMSYDLVSIKPEPETYNPYAIQYTSADKIKEVLKKGIYISTVNRDLKAKKDREAFLRSVLIGALVSLLFTISIELLTKWRNLNQRSGRNNPYA